MSYNNWKSFTSDLKNALNYYMIDRIVNQYNIGNKNYEDFDEWKYDFEEDLLHNPIYRFYDSQYYSNIDHYVLDNLINIDRHNFTALEDHLGTDFAEQMRNVCFDEATTELTIAYLLQVYCYCYAVNLTTLEKICNNEGVFVKYGDRSNDFTRYVNTEPFEPFVYGIDDEDDYAEDCYMRKRDFGKFEKQLNTQIENYLCESIPDFVSNERLILNDNNYFRYVIDASLSEEYCEVSFSDTEFYNNNHMKNDTDNFIFYEETDLFIIQLLKKIETIEIKLNERGNGIKQYCDDLRSSILENRTRSWVVYELVNSYVYAYARTIKFEDFKTILYNKNIEILGWEDEISACLK